MPQTHGRFIDVAPNYRTGAGPSENGHYTLYHDDLREAARRLGWEALTLVDRDQPADERVVPCLDGSDHVRMAESVGAQVRDDDLVVVYEGSLPVLSAVCGIAGAHPHARFVVNLFSTEGGLDGRDHIPPEVGELPPQRLRHGRDRSKGLGRPPARRLLPWDLAPPQHASRHHRGARDS